MKIKLSDQKEAEKMKKKTQSVYMFKVIIVEQVCAHIKLVYQHTHVDDVS